MPGFPDWQRITQWIGNALETQDDYAIGAGSHDFGPYNVGNFASFIVWIKPTGGAVTATVKQQPRTGPAGLEVQTIIAAAAGVAVAQSVVLLGDRVTVTVAGDTGGETVDLAFLPSNTAIQSSAIGGSVSLEASKAVLNAAQSIVTATVTAIAWSGVAAPGFDALGVWSGAAPSRFTIPAGTPSHVYEARLALGIEASPTQLDIALRLNGATIIAEGGVPLSGGSGGALTIAALYTLSAGDYLEALIRHNAGANRNTQLGDNIPGGKPYMELVRLS